MAKVSLKPFVAIDFIPTGPKGILEATITVKGTADCDAVDNEHPEADPQSAIESITGVAVQLGTSGVSQAASPTGPVSPKTKQKTWTTWTTDSLVITGVVNNRLEITAQVSAGQGPQKAEAEDTLTVTVDRTPPVLTLTTADDLIEEVKDGRATFTLAGTTQKDEPSGVVAVELMLDEGPEFTLATKVADDWSSWTATVQVPLGPHKVQLRARDEAGNTSQPTPVQLNAVRKFEPKDASDVFQRAAYLDELLQFTQLRIVDAQGNPITEGTLATIFHHRFVDLKDPNNRETATAPMSQLRVCVEVLRDFLAGKKAPPAEEAKYRARAYASLLRNLGTSFDEIRRARGDEATRARLADRLGVDRPERLDQLTLLPEQVTEKKLEKLFGLQDTTRDPLERASQPLLLTWQLDRLRAQWQEQDNAARVYVDIPVPIIDPDIVAKTDFRTPDKNADPAFALWNARKEEMNDLLKQIDDLRKSKSSPRAGFDAVVSQFVTKVADLKTLFADYQAGKDISARLIEKRLDLAAFLRLMRSRDLAVAGTILDADWADVSAIVAQVVKLGRYPTWRTDEQTKGLTLGPDSFVLADPTAAPIDLPEWRATLQARRAWQASLQTRINQKQNVVQTLRVVVSAAETEALPGLRDLLVTTAGGSTRGLLIELAAGAAQRTTRLAQAIETLQGVLFAVRAGAFTAGHSAAGWKLAPKKISDVDFSEIDFDDDWRFWGAYEAWQGALRVFIFPESYLQPSLRPTDEPTESYKTLITTLRKLARVTPERARNEAEKYLSGLRQDHNNALPPELMSSDFKITEQLTDKDLADRQVLSAKLMRTLTNPHDAPSHLKEVFYFVPLFCALQLQRSGEYLTALDWFQTVYAYHLPPGRLTADKLVDADNKPVLPPDKPLPDRRQIYYGLTLDEKIETRFQRSLKDWPRKGQKPHDILTAHEIARDRATALTRFVVISLVRCFAAFADAEFTRDTDESVARARTLYQTALDLLGSAYILKDNNSKPATGSSPPANPFGLDLVVEALSLHAESNLRKLRLGRNIAGLERQLSADLATETAVAPRQPTPYRYAALIARARDLTQTAAQMEAAMLAALEKRDAESYNLLKAIQDVELAGETVFLHALQVKEASDGIDLAALQKRRAEIQFKHFDDLINGGPSFWEGLEFVAGGTAALVNPLQLGSFFGQMASNEQREKDWRLQRDLAQQDEEIGSQQLILAADKVVVATQEQKIAQIQKDHTTANVYFLASKFTSAELYDFMSEVLDGVYRFFLQQATALAKLAENQLAFERQEAPQGVIQGDYYSAPDGTSDQRGITGSARLLADVVQLDQHAFLSDRRRLQLTKTFSMARLAPVEFAQFRETGVLIIGTPQELFDRDFPGHYVRLVKRVRTSVVALISPTDGIHATLSTTGTSRVVIVGDTFRNVVVRRDPETVGLSSPRDATGLFELVPDSQPELLLPFEGSGVDTVWRFELPKAANPFDYSTIADVLLTVEYTALNSFDYRQQVIQTLDPELSLDRPFSFRQQFPDQWYDLHNPDQTATPMVVRFKTTRGDFLHNIDDLKIQNLVLFFAPTNEKPFEMQGVRLLFKKQSDDAPVGGSADSTDGVISTRRDNGINWLPITGNKPPIGEWELALPTDDTTKNFFRNEDIEDILFVVSYSGRTPEWPD
jgi:Tc toxin complex TcA C-terminal TcB-binding domain